MEEEAKRMRQPPEQNKRQPQQGSFSLHAAWWVYGPRAIHNGYVCFWQSDRFCYTGGPVEVCFYHG
jgi:hypothetical protein